jgi:hypothetical protein
MSDSVEKIAGHRAAPGSYFSLRSGHAQLSASSSVIYSAHSRPVSEDFCLAILPPAFDGTTMFEEDCGDGQ